MIPESYACQVEACELDYAILDAARRMSNLSRDDYLPELGTVLEMVFDSVDDPLTLLRCQSLVVSILTEMAIPSEGCDS